VAEIEHELQFVTRLAVGEGWNWPALHGLTQMPVMRAGRRCNPTWSRPQEAHKASQFSHTPIENLSPKVQEGRASCRARESGDTRRCGEGGAPHESVGSDRMAMPNYASVASRRICMQAFVGRRGMRHLRVAEALWGGSWCRRPARSAAR
jgi:hypothetical protein